MTGNAELSALITRNIHDIEQVHAHLEGEMRQQLLEAVADAFRAELADGAWFLGTGTSYASDNWFCARQWLADIPDETQFYLILEETGVPGEHESWLASLTGTAPSGSGSALFVQNDLGGARRRIAQVLHSNESLMDRLLQRGLQFTSGDGLHIPILLDQSTVADGYEDGDLSASMEPLRENIALAKAAVDELHELFLELSA